MGRARQIVAFGGGGFSMESGNGLLDEYVLAATGVQRPRVCFLPSASGDADHYIVRLLPTLLRAALRTLPHLAVSPRLWRGRPPSAPALPGPRLRGRGSVISMLGVWRAHGLDVALREAWERGVVMCGLSAGSLCWFAEGMTAFHGDNRPVSGLRLLPCSNAVHYDKEPARRPAYRAAIAAGMVAGYAADDGAALHFVGTELARVVSSRPAARAYRVEAVDEEVVELPLAVDHLRPRAVELVA